MQSFIAFLSFFLICFSAVNAQTNTRMRTVATQLDTPWEILWGPDDWIWMTERKGTVSRVNPESGEIAPIINIDEVAEVGEGGLLGMAIDPDFTTNHFFYVAYNYYNNEDNYREKIVRYTFDPVSGKADEPYVLLEDILGASNHNGCRMIISPDKKLIFSTGDAQKTSTSQNLSHLSGKILRMNLDGTIPDDNPLENSLVWSWGHRNPQGLAWSPDGKTLYSSEHGPNSDDEMNIIQKGRNYGWPEVEGFCDNSNETTFCRDSNVVEPIFAWTPTLAVAGMAFYDSELIPELKNSLLVTSLKAGKLTQLRLNAAGTEVIENIDFFDRLYGRLRDVCLSPDGKIYVATSNRDGRGSPDEDDDKILEIDAVSTGAMQAVADDDLVVSPNPAQDVIQVRLPGNKQRAANYKLLSVNGQLLKSGILKSNLSEIRLPKTYAGLMVLQVTTGRAVYTKKIVTNR